MYVVALSVKFFSNQISLSTLNQFSRKVAGQCSFVGIETHSSGILGFQIIQSCPNQLTMVTKIWVFECKMVCIGGVSNT